MITFNVDGVERTVDAPGDASLLDVLRNGLNCRSVREGCSLGQCGACMVRVDGRAIVSCTTPAEFARGKRIVTARGLGSPERPHPLQQAFLDEQAAQCGYCVSGILVSASALLEIDPHPTEERIRHALDRNLCRCGSHGRMVRAVARAAGGLRSAAAPQGAPPRFAATDPEPRFRLADRLVLRGDGVLELLTGKVEIGQGVTTALAQIAADELDIELERVHVKPARTGESANEGTTAGSRSMQYAGAALRELCAGVRAGLIEYAAKLSGAPAGSMRAANGEVRAPDGRSYSYVELARAGAAAAHSSQPKSRAARRIIGASAPRRDLPAKVFGAPAFIHDIALPGMLHGRILRPPSPAARLVSVDLARIAALPGVVEVVREGNFSAVVALREDRAVQGLHAMRASARWDERPSLPDEARLAAVLREGKARTRVVRDTGSAPACARMLRWVFSKPYLAHGSIGPSCALAHREGDALRVWTHSQSVYALRAALAAALGMAEADIVVEHAQGAGCYGHNGADDAAFDAARLACAVPGRPVRVQWTLEDELGWSPFGPAMRVEIEAGADAQGRIRSWSHDIWSSGHAGRPGNDTAVRLLGANHALGRPTPASMDIGSKEGGADRNAIPAYCLPAVRVRNHHLVEMPLRTSALRSLGAFMNVFAIESAMDEIARRSRVDPLDYRLALLDDPRARSVLDAAARRSGWVGRQRGEGLGWGLAFARYKNSAACCAAVAQIEVAHELRVRKLTIAVDAGLVVNPDGVVNQIEGGAVQAASWTLKEAVRFDGMRVTSTSWETYPVLIFSEVPAVDVVLVDSGDDAPLGVGEASCGPVGAAIGNALRDALGVRVCDLPLTRERITAAIDSQIE